MILYDLCWATDKMTIQQFADKYFVSRGQSIVILLKLKNGVIKTYSTCFFKGKRHLY